MKEKIVGIAVDPWKLDIFKRHLDEAEFEYRVESNAALTIIKVKTSKLFQLQNLVEAAQRECAKIL